MNHQKLAVAFVLVALATGFLGAQQLTVPTLSWSGSWLRDGTNRYISDRIGDGEETWQTLTINAPSGGMLRVTITASSEYRYDFGIVSRLNGSMSRSGYRFRVSGTQSETFTDDLQTGTHTIYFGYVKNDSISEGDDRVIVEVAVEAAPVGAAKGSRADGSYAIGDIGPAGGIVFYDKGSVSDGWRYLEAAPARTEFSAQWRGAREMDVAGTDTSIGSGKENTRLIVKHLNAMGESNRAAQGCAALNVNGFSDWFLPSKDELNLMYTNLSKKGLGGFKIVTRDNSNMYWSSSQASTNGAWNQGFSGGAQLRITKTHVHSVRAARAF